MWKEASICVVIVIVIIVANMITQNYTKESVADLVNKMEILKAEISKEKSEIDKEIVKGKMQDIDNSWDSRHDKLAYFIEHDELEKVKTNITSMRSFVETEEYADSMNEIDKSVFVLYHIEDKYAFNLQNVF